ncbi:hypothetical protein HDU92_001071 [Lobulomyces angularis]|nr:hypothetical protein HDU92_001071 [Lobulomyces angularis]
MVKVLYWAKAKELVGISDEEVYISAPTPVSHFILKLENLHPILKTLNNTNLYALNMEFITNFNSILNNNDEFAIIPPVSGG